jgi:PKD repeat protein
MQAVIAISPRRKTLIEANLCNPPVAAVPTANFTVDNQFVLLGGEASFTDLSSNFPNGWNWTFEGGDPGTSNDRNPKIKYNTPGVYNVTLTAKNSLGFSAPLEKVDYITVSDQGLCGRINNFKETYTQSIIRLSEFGNYKGFLTGHNSLKSKGISEFFKNALGYRYISGVNIRFGKAFTLKEDASVNVVVWNARGAQNAPGSVIEKKVVLFKQIKDDIANNRATSIIFDRETPVFSKPFQVGIEIAYAGDSLAVISSANGEALDATSWIQDINGVWKPFAIAFGANIALDIETLVGMKPSVQVSVSTPLAYPGQEVTLNGRGASIFVWNSNDGEVNNVTGPQLVVNPLETTTYTVTGSGIELCNDVANTTIYVSHSITNVPERNIDRSLTLYPNPGHSSFRVKFENELTGMCEIKVFSMMGEEMSQTFRQEKTEFTFDERIDTPMLSSGMYFVQVQMGKLKMVSKWICKE